MKKFRVYLWICLSGIGIIAAAAITLGLILYINCSKDIARLKTESYDTVFFSMYPTDNYDEYHYSHYRGMTAVKTSYPMHDSRIMKWYMDTAIASGNEISTAYLGIDPIKVRTEDVFQIVLENENTLFEIVLAYPGMDYWMEMSPEDCQKAWETYREFAGNVLGLGNTRVYYFCNEEWLLCNPGNYEDVFQTNKAVSELLMCYSDDQHNNILNVENFHRRFNEAWRLLDKYREYPIEYPDASEWEIVFLGDSVIGNYTDSLSIPGVVNGLTGATVFNCGYGGKSAALSESTLESIVDIVDALIQKDTTNIPKEPQVYRGLEKYIAESDAAKKKLFVINHGLNDYFNGLPIDTEDAEDEASYRGAIRAAVKKLQEAFPEAHILLMTPNLSICFDFGEGIQSEYGAKLIDYADALIELGQELDVTVLDNYRELPIEKERYWVLLEDGTHPNAQGRFQIGNRIITILETLTAE